MRAIDRFVVKTAAKKLLANRRARRETGLYPLNTLLLYVTMRCNAKCDHCFCWEDLNVGIPEMTREQLARVAETMPPVELLVLTGGEPMMRKDLPEIMGEFARRGKAETLHINTNALMPAKMEELARSFKKEYPGTGLSFQISLDGLRETHDRIRGVPGNFDKVIDALRRLFPLQKELPAFSVHVLTVVTAVNYKELVDLNTYLREAIDPEIYQGFEMVRDVDTTAWNIPEEVKEQGVGPKAMAIPPVEAFPEIAEAYRIVNSRSPIKADAFRVHCLATLKMLETEKEQFPCVTAGQAVGVVYSNGDVAHCEFTLPFANLEKYGHNFNDLWLGPEATERRGQITGCHCIHGCFHGKAVEYSWKGIAQMARLALK